MQKKPILIGVLALCFTLSLSFSAHAFSSLVAYGDSLTDNGNLGLRYTDGPLWVEVLSDATGSELYDVAYAGATTGMDNPAAAKIDPAYTDMLGLQWQIGAFQPGFSTTHDMSDTLFTVWAGANDFFQGRDANAAADNIGSAIQALIDSGAQDILVPNLPDLGNTPAFYNDVNPDVSSAMASGWTMAFNTALEAELATFESYSPGINLYALDAYGISDDLLERNANGDILNFDELFWDGVHPTHIGHEALAAKAYQLVNPVPIPAAIWLFGPGVGLLISLRRKYNR
jgi:cholinesterase